MDILIGKEGNQPFPLKEASISRKHALFHMDERTGVMTLRDIGSVNGTYIKDNDGAFKRINSEVKVSFSTIVRLGAVHTFTVKELLKQAGGDSGNNVVDISKLRNVYEVYNTNRMDLEAQTSGIMMLRLAAMTVSTILVNVILLVIPEDSMDKVTRGGVQAVGSIAAIGLAWVLVGVKNKSLIRRKDLNERYFKKNYCCPKCGYHFGNHIYSNILAEGHCPNKSCRCKFSGK